MPTLPAQLSADLATALNQAGIELPEGVSADVTAAQDTRFGDYQTNIAMVLAKSQRTNPRALATSIVENFPAESISETPQIAGPGFINFKVKPEAFASLVTDIARDTDGRCGMEKVANPKTIVLDFSAPNVAKPMHVGHIRSTIIGDTLARVARFAGHNVITDNHIGDWGTQFGMIIYGWKNILDQDALAADPIAELLRVYKTINDQCKADESVRDACKLELVALQAGDEANLEIWQKCVELSKQGLQGIYDKLDVHFDHWLGESAYNDRLGPLVERLIDEKIAEESDGAICVFFPDNKALEEKPCLIRKGDGGFLYATTDLATIDFRVEEWKADEIWYVVGAPQQLHFQQIFEVAAKMGHKTNMEHIAHGSILGSDRKLMRTRSGDNVQLTDVLTEAVERSRAIIEEKNPSLTDDEKETISEIVGIGSVKFAELSQHRMTDYIFSWDKMLALTGDTAPYLQYSFVRIQSIFRKLAENEGLDQAGIDTLLANATVALSEDGELTLARQLGRFAEIVPMVLDGHRPNLLCSYLLELARAFHSFFEACPVLKATDTATRDSRLVLAHATARTLETGLGLLGIRVPEKM
ncbi:arginine--tRNA ligase [Sulfuriroseicoccus oceanibius]|uniref:Arginine--tRNA ligase n=1 Tax=Sulfuriroseicoccus oceanibius TaxID=2707525 RepID=A0A6B3LE16_9BACT|nr:arginine--tRNA ligase [Sulfuriroseicoccus oceanibius]QQL44396.1 arginine--tRNA ligase [Sulfuriroseicoccus oceanibius]